MCIANFCYFKTCLNTIEQHIYTYKSTFLVTEDAWSIVKDQTKCSTNLYYEIDHEQRHQEEHDFGRSHHHYNHSDHYLGSSMHERFGNPGKGVL